MDRSTIWSQWGSTAPDVCSRLFTVNQWVVGDDWADAATTIPLLYRFDMQMPRPSYLVNRWLTAVLVAYEAEIIELLHQRDRVLNAHAAAGGVSVRDDRTLEVLSEYRISAQDRFNEPG